MALGEKKSVLMETDIGELVPPKNHAEQHRGGGSDPITPDMVGAACRPNLLDNWCFLPGFVVNQRGQDSYPTDGIWLDRFHGQNAKGELTASGCTITKTSDDGTGLFFQISENNILARGKYTLTALYEYKSKVQLGTDTFDFSPGAHTDTNQIAVGGDWYVDMYMDFAHIQNGTYSVRVYNVDAAGGACTLIAVKLELGDTQTLAHLDENGNWVLNEYPNYAEQLARCQRYYQQIGNAGLQDYSTIGTGFVERAGDTACGVIPLAVPMRMCPVASMYGQTACSSAEQSTGITGVQTIYNSSPAQIGVQFSLDGSMPIGGAVYFWAHPNGGVRLSAEL